MTPERFRRDPWLRTSASHLATWSLAAAVLDVLLRASPHVSAATAAVMLVVVVGSSVVSSMTTERRIAKMVGQAGAPVDASIGRLWLFAAAMLVPVSVALVASMQADTIPAVWMVGVGGMFVVWGRRTNFDWYVTLGFALAGAGLLDSYVASREGPVAIFRLIVLGVAVPAAAIATNRRWLWIREAR